MAQPIPIVTQLEDVFPGIEEELCSRHSTLLSQLVNTFKSIYDEPSHFVSVKAQLQIAATNCIQLSFGLENGFSILVSRIDDTDRLFINGNHFTEEVIMNTQGKLQSGNHEYHTYFSKIIELASEDLALNKLHSGAIYVHTNIARNSFDYREIMLIGMFLGLCIINGIMEEYTQAQLIDKMAKCGALGNETVLRRRFACEHYYSCLETNGHLLGIPFQKKHKLVLFQLPSTQNINTESNPGQTNTQSILPTSSTVINDLLQCYNNNQLSFSQLISKLWQHNCHIQQHTTKQIEQLQQIRQLCGVESCLIIDQKYALIVISKQRFADLFVTLRRKLQTKDVPVNFLQQRWSGNKQVHEQMFSSVPSRSVSILSLSSN